MSTAGWLEHVHAAAPGAELLGFLERRFSAPHREGPAPDERRSEAVEEVFVELAKQDEGFRERLDETIAGYLKGSSADPADASARPVLRGVFELVGILSLAVSGSRARAWLARHDATLRAETSAVLGRAALDALATTQVRGTSDGRDFWLRLWRSGPDAWQWRAFIGLRLQDPRTAANELPELLRRLEACSTDPAPMLLGMWKQPEARPVLLEWLRTTREQRTASRVREALRGLISSEEQVALAGSRPRAARRKLPSLALPATDPRPWDTRA